MQLHLEQILTATAPRKPVFGAPCNGCGYCCQQEVCRVGSAAFGDVAAPCPTLLFVQGRYWCGLVLAVYEARRQDPSVLPVLEDTLAIGRGCDAETEEAGETSHHGWPGARMASLRRDRDVRIKR
jgi:hypothetical protein